MVQRIMQNIKKFPSFRNIYHFTLGIPMFIALLTIANACSKVLPGSKTEDIFGDFNIGIPLLLLGIGCMIILFFKAKYKIKVAKDKVTQEINHCKENIQLAGYLLTLIGFLIAIMGLVKAPGAEAEPFNLSSIAFPIGLALVTSIIGWWCGNELNDLSTEKDILGSSLDILRKNIEELSDEVFRAKSKYETSTNEFTQQLNQLLEKQKSVIQDFNSSHNKMIKINQKLLKTNETSTQNIEKAVEALTAKYSEKLEEASEQSVNAFSSLEKKTAQAISSLNGSISQINESISSSIENIDKLYQDVLNNKISLDKEFKDHLKNVSKMLTKTISDSQNKFNDKLQNISNKYEEGLLDFSKSSAKNLKGLMKELSQSLQDFNNHSQTNSDLIKDSTNQLQKLYQESVEKYSKFDEEIKIKMSSDVNGSNQELSKLNGSILTLLKSMEKGLGDFNSSVEKNNTVLKRIHDKLDELNN